MDKGAAIFLVKPKNANKFCLHLVRMIIKESIDYDHTTFNRNYWHTGQFRFSKCDVLIEYFCYLRISAP